jgi:hypothetical protein
MKRLRHLLACTAAAALLSAAGCSTPCQELGDVVCKCTPTGTSQDTCKRQVASVVSSANPTTAQENYCSDRLDTCKAPTGVNFCDWLQSGAGKEACGLAY